MPFSMLEFYAFTRQLIVERDNMKRGKRIEGAINITVILMQGHPVAHGQHPNTTPTGYPRAVKAFLLLLDMFP